MTDDSPSAAPPTPAPPPPPVVPKQAWGEPLVKLDKKWTSFESKLCVWVLLAEIAALCFWIALKGLSSEYSPGGGDVSGLVFRSLITSVALGMVVHKVTKPDGTSAAEPRRGQDQGHAKTETADRHAWFVTGAVFVGLLLGRTWVTVGVEYSSNLL